MSIYVVINQQMNNMNTKFKVNIVARMVLWLILFLTLFDVGFKMISSPSTIENVTGFFTIMAMVVISIKTRCLTNIKFKQ